jgi:hypothetical protein
MTVQTVADLHYRRFELVEDEGFAYDRALNEFTRTGEVGAEWDSYVAARAAREEFYRTVKTLGMDGLIEIVNAEEKVMIKSNQIINKLCERYDELVENEDFADAQALDEFTHTGEREEAWDELVAARAARAEFENVILTIGLDSRIAIVKAEG